MPAAIDAIRPEWRYSFREAASLLGVHPVTIRRRIQAGTLRAHGSPTGPGVMGRDLLGSVGLSATGTTPAHGRPRRVRRALHTQLELNGITYRSSEDAT